MNWLDYREKLGIGFNDKEKGQLFITNILNELSNFIYSGFYVYDEEYLEFCNVTGIFLKRDNSAISIFKLIEELHYQTDVLEQFLAFFLAFINALDENISNRRIVKEELISLLQDASKRAKIQMDIIKDDDGYFAFPKGAEQFDKALISENLLWLSEYPNSEKAWSKALRAYADSKSDNASDVADLFRKALETFFQDYFGGNKALENYKVQYHAYLNEKGVPEEIAKNFELNLQQYTNYMNNYAKHRDATSVKVLEYIMYQTGNIIRLLITLKHAN